MVAAVLVETVLAQSRRTPELLVLDDAVGEAIGEDAGVVTAVQLPRGVCKADL